MRGNVEEIKERLDIAEVIGGYIKVEKAGANFKAKCPFHNEKTASFFISPSRQSYYCFGCGEKGDIFTFVQEMEGVDFKEALKTLASKAGVELKYERGESTDDKERLYEVLEEATKFFESELEKSDDAKKYLLSRGVVEESVKVWRLGYVVEEWRTLREHLLAKGFDDVTLTKAGLIKKSEDHKEKEPYDVFRGRIIFPIFDEDGRVIAFSGRALAQDALAKYLNSPETPLFSKNKVLYGLNKAKREIQKAKYVLLVEGQMDLVLSHQSGVKNTVASSGTAFTAQHLQRLKRLSTRITLAFDGDDAGHKAAEKSAALALSLELEVKIAKLPLGKDPADLVRESPDVWKALLRNTKPVIEAFMDEILETKDQAKIRREIQTKLIPLISLIPSRIEKEHAVSQVARFSGKSPQVITEEVSKVKPSEALATMDLVTVEGTAIVRISRSRTEELDEVVNWLKDNPKDVDLMRKEAELTKLMKIDELDAQIDSLRLRLVEGGDEVLKQIGALNKERDEERRKLL